MAQNWHKIGIVQFLKKNYFFDELFIIADASKVEIRCTKMFQANNKGHVAQLWCNFGANWRQMLENGPKWFKTLLFLSF